MIDSPLASVIVPRLSATGTFNVAGPVKLSVEPLRMMGVVEGIRSGR